MLINQALSLNVIKAPVPALLPDHFSRWLKKSGVLRVVVKESQLLSWGRE